MIYELAKVFNRETMDWEYWCRDGNSAYQQPIIRITRETNGKQDVHESDADFEQRAIKIFDKKTAEEKDIISKTTTIIKTAEV